MERAFYRPSPAARISLTRRIWIAMTVSRQRHRLMQLDDHILRDIGIDRAAADAEASRPLWDVPAHWIR